MPRASTFIAPRFLATRLLLPLAALLATLPLILHGNSCGQDLTFHLQSWLDAAQQLRHFHYPQWDSTAAWNAGEPRFLFYPPLSWLLGAALTVLLPISAAPIAFIFLALLLSGLTFHHFARNFASPNAALIASAIYLANPYMLFVAFERSALAELLAAAWIPLLLLALLRPRPTIRGIAIPLALLWLTNAPAAVMGSYLLAFLALIRVLHALTSRRPRRTRLTLTYLAGTLLGLTLPAFYLLPAAYERRFIQSEMAIIPPLRYQDNFLFTHTADAAHNAVNHTASLLALTLLLLTAATLLALSLVTTRSIQTAVILSKAQSLQKSVILSEGRSPQKSASRAQNPQKSVILSGAQSAQPKDPDALHPTHTASPFPTTDPTQTNSAETLRTTHSLTAPPAAKIPLLLTLLLALIAFLLTPLSTPIWHHLPELAFLQFPWRLLTVLTPILALAIALLLDHTALSPPETSILSTENPGISKENPGISTEGRRPQWRDPESSAPLTGPPQQAVPGAPCMTASSSWVGYATIFLTLALPLALSLTLHHLYAQSCDPTDTPSTLAHNLATHHGILPTDEYTPASADNDLLRTNNPAYWLAPLTNPNAPAPNTTPTATELNPSIDTDDTPIPLSQTLSTAAPHHLTLNLPHPAILVLHLRAYPNWHLRVTHTKQPSPSAQDSRNDDLLAIALPSGPSTIDIAWRRSPDQTLGLALSALALLTLALTLRRDD